MASNGKGIQTGKQANVEENIRTVTSKNSSFLRTFSANFPELQYLHNKEWGREGRNCTICCPFCMGTDPFRKLALHCAVWSHNHYIYRGTRTTEIAVLVMQWNRKDIIEEINYWIFVLAGKTVVWQAYNWLQLAWSAVRWIKYLCSYAEVWWTHKNTMYILN